MFTEQDGVAYDFFILVLFSPISFPIVDVEANNVFFYFNS